MEGPDETRYASPGRGCVSPFMRWTSPGRGIEAGIHRLRLVGPGTVARRGRGFGPYPAGCIPGPRAARVSAATAALRHGGTRQETLLRPASLGFGARVLRRLP